MDIQTNSELSFYTDSNVVVTQSRFVTNSQACAMRNISSVHVYEIVASKKLPVIIGTLGLVLLMASDAKMFGTMMLLIGVVMFFAVKNSFDVRISTNSDEANSIISRDNAYIEKIVNALNEAIIHRG